MAMIKFNILSNQRSAPFAGESHQATKYVRIARKNSSAKTTHILHIAWAPSKQGNHRHPVIARAPCPIFELPPIDVWVPLSSDQIRKTRCPVCDGETSTYVTLNFINGRGLPIKRCNADGMIYLEERPDEAWWTNVYSAREYYGNGLNQQLGYPESYFKLEERRTKDAELRVQDVLRVVGNRRGLWVDVGGGAGFVASQAKKEGWNVTVVETNAAGVETLKAKGIQSIVSPWEHATVEDGSVDVLSFFDVMEHLLDLDASLDKAHDVLAADGILVIRVPDLSNLNRRNQHVLLNISREHVNYFTQTSMRRLLEDHGYDLFSIQPSGRTELAEGVFYQGTTFFARAKPKTHSTISDLTDFLESHDWPHTGWTGVSTRFQFSRLGQQARVQLVKEDEITSEWHFRLGIGSPRRWRKELARQLMELESLGWLDFPYEDEVRLKDRVYFQ